MITIIPAIDLIEGKCVRLTQGDYGKSKTYSSDPVETAKSFEDAGLAFLHLVDLEGAKSKAPANLKVLEKIASKTSLRIDFGGGIKSEEAVRSALDSGAESVVCGSVAVSNPEGLEQWLKKYGNKLILGADMRGGKIATHGWLKDSDIKVENLISKYSNKGIDKAICTDISKDGMLQGVDKKYYKALQEKFPEVEIIVSGGISSLNDIKALEEEGLRKVIVGKAIYEGRITLKELSKLC